MTSYPASTGVVTVKDPRPALARVFLGARADPLWARPALWGLLALTAALYLWDLTASGFANTFYAAAVQAGAGRLEGLVLRVARRVELHHRRQAAGVALGDGALGPPLRVLQREPPGAAGADGCGLGRAHLRRGPPHARALRTPGLADRRTPRRIRARLHPRRRADVPLRQPGRPAGPAHDRSGICRGAGTAEGVVEVARPSPVRCSASPSSPRCCRASRCWAAFALVYLIAAPARLRTRLVHLAIAAGALVVAAGWWVLAVALWPADARPYIGGSTNNSVLDPRLRLQRLRSAVRRLGQRRRRRRQLRIVVRRLHRPPAPLLIGDGSRDLLAPPRRDPRPGAGG